MTIIIINFLSLVLAQRARNRQYQLASTWQQWRGRFCGTQTHRHEWLPLSMSASMPCAQGSMAFYEDSALEKRATLMEDPKLKSAAEALWLALERVEVLPSFAFHPSHLVFLSLVLGPTSQEKAGDPEGRNDVLSCLVWRTSHRCRRRRLLAAAVFICSRRTT